MLVNTFSTTFDKDFGNSLVYDLSAIDDSWTYIAKHTGGDPLSFNLFSNYTKIMIIMFGSSNTVSTVYFLKDNSNHPVNQIFGISNGLGVSAAFIINKNIIPSNCVAFSSSSSSVYFYAK